MSFNEAGREKEDTAEKLLNRFELHLLAIIATLRLYVHQSVK
jgi:hypothetical protein